MIQSLTVGYYSFRSRMNNALNDLKVFKLSQAGDKKERSNLTLLWKDQVYKNLASHCVSNRRQWLMYVTCYEYCTFNAFLTEILSTFMRLLSRPWMWWQKTTKFSNEETTIALVWFQKQYENSYKFSSVLILEVTNKWQFLKCPTYPKHLISKALWA